MGIMFDERFDGPRWENLKMFNELRAEGFSFDVDTPEEFAALPTEVQDGALANYRSQPLTPEARAGAQVMARVLLRAQEYDARRAKRLLTSVEEVLSPIPEAERQHLELGTFTPREPDPGYWDNHVGA